MPPIEHEAKFNNTTAESLLSRTVRLYIMVQDAEAVRLPIQVK